MNKEQQIEAINKIVQERDSFQNVIYPGMRDKLHERGKELIAVKKVRNHLREVL